MNEEEFNKSKIYSKLKSFLHELKNNENLFFSRNLYPIIAIIIVSIAFIFLLIYNHRSASSSNEILTIKASKEPIKIRPLDPGGMIVHNIDKSVYNNLFNKNINDLPRVERILPLPEKPLDIKNITSQNLIPALDHDPIKEESSKKALNNDDTDQKEKTLDNKNFPSKDSDKIQIKKLLPSHKSKINNFEIQSPVKRKGKYKIQLASFKNEQEAISEWKKIKLTYPLLFNKLEPYICPKEIINKGTYYRLQTGPFNNDYDARLLCKKLSKMHQACIIVKD